MSKHSTSGSPASSASSSAPPTPPAGPERTVSAACAPARRGVGEAARGLHDLRLAQAQRARLRREPVAGRRRAAARARRRARSWPCARTRGRCPRARRRATRGRRAASSASRLAEQPLVRGVGVGVQQRHRDRLRARARRAPRTSARAAAASSAQQRAVWAHALGRREAQLRGHERRGRRPAQAVQVRAVLAAELDHVGEARRGEQRGARRAALQQRVRGDRHAVREALDVLAPARRRARAPRAPPRARPLDSLGRRGGDLGGVDGAVVVEQHRVGEGAADVDAQEHALEPTRALRRCQLAILGVGEVLVGGAVAVVRQRRALAGRALAGGRAALRRRAADRRVALVRVLGQEQLRVAACSG